MDLFKEIDLSKAVKDSFDGLFNHNPTFDLIPHVKNTATTHHTNLATTQTFDFSLAPLLNFLIWSIIFIALAYFYYLLLKLIPKILSLISNLKQQYVILEIKPLRDTKLSAESTKQLFEFIHGLVNQKTKADKFLLIKKNCSFEIVSSKSLGIRYLLRIYKKDEDIIRKKLLSYFPEISINKTDDYLPNKFEKFVGFYKVVELKLSEHFAAPLKKKDDLEEDDPISYITGNMTKLENGEIVALQLLLSPVDYYSHKSAVQKKDQVNNWINLGYDLSHYLKKKNFNIFLKIPILLFKIVAFVFMVVFGFVLDLIRTAAFHEFSHHTESAFDIFSSKPKYKQTDNPYHRELELQAKSKVNSDLFETTIRLFALSYKKSPAVDKVRGLTLAFKQFENKPHQKLINAMSFSNFGLFNNKKLEQIKYLLLKNRLDFLSQTTILSSSEIADIYHLPYTTNTKTEDIAKTYAKELPAPLSFKQDRKYDVILGKNTYGGATTFIGLTDEERARHVLIIGGSGTGKSEQIKGEIVQDIQKGRGVCVIDPHGDLTNELRYFIPLSRAADFVWLDPDDLDNPVIINLLELKPGLIGNALLREKQRVCETVIALFRKIFDDEGTWSPHAHRIEHILRNAIYTAFEIEDRTIFTVLDLFEDPVFNKQIVNSLKNPDLKKFWKGFYGKGGDWQQVKMMGGIVSRISAFLNTPSAKRMMDKPHSTIDFDEIMDQKKILLCNLSRGNLTEPVSELIGLVILSKIQVAALRRARTEPEKRTPFYLYVDEFQYFATKSFVQMLSEGRKFGLRITIVYQSTAQQADDHLTNVIFANVGTVIFFRNSSTMDEDRFLPIFFPYVPKGSLNYLPSFHFYIKISAMNPEEPFSAETIMIKTKKDPKKSAKLMEESRNRYTMSYQDSQTEEAQPMGIKPNGQAGAEEQLEGQVQLISATNTQSDIDIDKYT